MALQLDYSDTSCVEVANHADLNPNNITMAACIYPLDNFPASGVWVMCKNYTSHSAPYYQYGITLYDTAGHPKGLYEYISVGGTWYYGAGGDNSGWTYNTWNWVFVAYDGETIRTYLNAVEKFTDTSPSGNIDSYATPLILGANKRGGSESSDAFEGYIADCRIYNRALSVAELQAIVDGKGIDNIKSGLQSRWFMKELPAGSNCTGANVVRDMSGNGHHGTPQNTPIYRADRLWRAMKVVVT